ncbi:hypothetical protein AAEX28_08255 [Lentisphaerota bacterium WC36G]|nr:hypothetical protein LJT99_11110 [Lentisphaerae bacterium WC36]
MKLTEHKINALMFTGAIILLAFFTMLIQNFNMSSPTDNSDLTISQAINDKLTNETIFSVILEDIKNIDKPFFLRNSRNVTNPLSYMVMERNDKMTKALINLGANSKTAMQYLSSKADIEYLKEMINEAKAEN